MGILKSGADAFDRSEVHKRTGNWDVADGIGALLKKPEERTMGDELSLSVALRSPSLLDLFKR